MSNLANHSSIPIYLAYEKAATHIINPDRVQIIIEYIENKVQYCMIEEAKT